MRQSALPYTLLISCLLAILRPCTSMAQSLYPTSEGDRTGLKCNIDMSRGYISGICILVKNGDLIKGGIYNEFGISAVNFTYNEKKDKVKILTTLKMMDKWYIKRLLRKDLRHVMQGLKNGDSTYENKKFHISYTFTPIQKIAHED